MTKSSWLLLVCVGSFACQNSHEPVNQDAGLDAAVVSDSATADVSLQEVGLDAGVLVDSASADASSQDAANDSAIDAGSPVAAYVQARAQSTIDSCFCKEIPEDRAECEFRSEFSARYGECLGAQLDQGLRSGALTMEQLDCANAQYASMHACVREESQCDEQRYDDCQARAFGASCGSLGISYPALTECVKGPPNPVCPDLASSALGNDLFALDPDGHGVEYPLLASYLRAPHADLTFEWTAPHAGDFLISASRSDFATALCVRPGMCGPLQPTDCLRPSGDAAMMVVRAEAGQSFFLAAAFSYYSPPPTNDTWRYIGLQSGLVRIDVNPYVEPACAPATNPSPSQLAIDTRARALRAMCANESTLFHVGELEWIAPATGRYRISGRQNPYSVNLATIPPKPELAVIRSACLSTIVQMDCDQRSVPNQDLTIDLVAGETIVIRVGAPNIGFPVVIDVTPVNP